MSVWCCYFTRQGLDNLLPPPWLQRAQTATMEPWLSPLLSTRSASHLFWTKFEKWKLKDLCEISPIIKELKRSLKTQRSHKFFKEESDLMVMIYLTLKLIQTQWARHNENDWVVCVVTLLWRLTSDQDILRQVNTKAWASDTESGQRSDIQINCITTDIWCRRVWI